MTGPLPNGKGRIWEQGGDLDLDTALIVATVIMFVILVALLMKRLQPQFCLIIVGLIAVVVMEFVTGESCIETSTGNLFFDGFAYLQESMVSSFTSTGITLIVVLGYVAFMNALKASDVFAITVAKVVTKIKSKYVILILALFIGCLIKWVIPSAVTAFLMMYATIYPILRRCGIGRITAICAITISMAWSMGPGQPFTGMLYGTFDPEANMTAPDFFVNYELKYFIPTFIVCAAVFLGTTKFFDARDAKHPVEFLSPDEVGNADFDIKSFGIPRWYGLLPIIPLFAVILLGGQVIPGIRVGVVPVYLFFAILVVFIECIRKKSLAGGLESFETVMDGMGESFARYATVAWAGVVFADGLTAVGGLDILAEMFVAPDISAPILLIIGGLLVFIITALTGQVMLGLFGLCPAIVAAAGIIGADVTYILTPICAAATGSNILSVAAAVTLVSAEKAGIPVTSFIIRQAVPCFASILTIILCCAFMFA